MTDPIRIDGLNEFRRNLKTLDRDLPKALRLAFNAAADLVVAEARPKVPSRSGRARASVRVLSSQTAAKVAGGSRRVPYYPWLDFGGRVGRNRSVSRQFYSDGRYIYAAYYRQRSRIEPVLAEKLIDVARQAGIEVE
jgi:hypothetical protein